MKRLNTLRVCLRPLAVAALLLSLFMVQIKAQREDLVPLDGEKHATTSKYVLPVSEGKVLSQLEYSDQGRVFLLALTLSTENEAAPTFRLRRYAIREGQVILPAMVTSFQQQAEEERPLSWNPISRIRWQADMKRSGDKVLLLLTGTSQYKASLALRVINPSVYTKATLPRLMVASAQEIAQAKKRIAQGKVVLPPNFRIEDLSKPYWRSNPTDGEKPPHATLVKDFFHNDWWPMGAEIEKVTSESVLVHIKRKEDEQSWSLVWRQGPLRYLYNSKTRKWSEVKPSQADKVAIIARQRLQTRQFWMPEYRRRREVFGQSKEQAISGVRQTSGIKDWTPLPQAWDTPDLKAKHYWLTPTPEPPTAEKPKEQP